MATAKATTADAADADAPARPKGKLPSKKVMIIAAAALLLVGGGSGAFFMFKPKHAPPPAAPVVKPVVFVELPDVLVNLSNANAERAQYLKVRIVLEVADQAIATQINPVMPRVMDAFQTYLRELRPTDLEGSAGLYRLKEELTRRVNLAIEPAHINAVLFKELVIQ